MPAFIGLARTAVALPRAVHVGNSGVPFGATGRRHWPPRGPSWEPLPLLLPLPSAPLADAIGLPWGPSWEPLPLPLPLLLSRRAALLLVLLAALPLVVAIAALPFAPWRS